MTSSSADCSCPWDSKRTGITQGPVKVALCPACDVSQAAHGPTLPAEVAGRRAEAPSQLVGRNGHLATLPRPWLLHVDVDRLRAAYWAVRPQAAPGVDGVTWAAWGQELEANLADLHDRVHAGRYRARPSRRAYIPKADGRSRPLGIATLEDKILQWAVVEVLNAVYEADFLGFSYGFRLGRSPHQALDALSVGIGQKKVNWVRDADIRDFFTSLDHGWLER